MTLGEEFHKKEINCVPIERINTPSETLNNQFCGFPRNVSRLLFSYMRVYIMCALLIKSDELLLHAEQGEVGDEFPETVGQPDVDTSAGDMSTEVPESWDLRDCFTSHFDCPNENVTFHLYTRCLFFNPMTHMLIFFGCIL